MEFSLPFAMEFILTLRLARVFRNILDFLLLSADILLICIEFLRNFILCVSLSSCFTGLDKPKEKQEKRISLKFSLSLLYI